MHYKNPIDKELVLSADEVYNSLARLCESLSLDMENLHIANRLRDALHSAKTEMQLQEEMDRQDFITTDPPTSND